MKIGNTLKSSLIGFTGASLMVATTALSAAGSLNVSNWSEYMAKDTISNFEKEFDVKVIFTPYDSVEAIDSKLIAGNSGYDVVAHAASQIARLLKGNIIQKIDKSKLSNISHMSDQVMSQIAAKWDPGHNYMIPYMWGTHGVTYNEQLVKKFHADAPIGSLDMIFDPKHMKKLAKCGVAFLDSPTDIIPMALTYLGLQPDSTNKVDYKKAEALLKKVRPYIKTFDNYAYQRMPEREFCVTVTFGPDGLFAMDAAAEANTGVVLDFFLPKTPNFWVDAWVIPADAKNIKNAHLFMNYLMRPQVSANDSSYSWYATPNKTALPLVDKAVTSSPAAYPTDAQVATMYTLSPLPAKIERIRTRVWTNFKAGL